VSRILELWRRIAAAVLPKPDPDDDNRSDAYSPAHRRRLIDGIGRVPLHKPFGRGLCPFCIHLEARWRRELLPGGGVQVRVRCSQCQKGLIYSIAAP